MGKQIMVAGLAVVLVFAAWPFGQQTAYADQTVYAQTPEAEWATDDYDAVPFTTQDLAAIGTIVALQWSIGSFTLPALYEAIPATAVIAYGAWRTNKYRSQAEQERIRTVVNARPASHPGGYPGL